MIKVRFQNTLPWVLGLILLGNLAFCQTPSVSSSANTDTNPKPPEKIDANISTIESRCVRFKPNFPLAAGSLDLFGYEATHGAKGEPIVSPDKQWMVMAEVFFLPDSEQTLSRIDLTHVGREPTLAQVLPPQDNTEKKRHAKQAVDAYGQVDVKSINPRPIWARYEPGAQAASRQTLLEVGFDRPQRYKFDVLQPVDWSEDSHAILIVYRAGIHHLGLYRTIPIVYDITQHESIRYTMLPEMIWADAKTRLPELTTPSNRVWDIRPLGWRQGKAQEMISKLVIFDGQSELPLGFWSFNVSNSALEYLGDTIAQTMIARNGWLAYLTDPKHPEENPNEKPGQAPAQHPDKPKSSWRDRLPFRKKQS